MRFARPIAIGASLLCAGVFACSLVTSYEGFTPADAPPTCGKRIPARPTRAAPGGAGKLHGAVSFIRFVDEPDAGTLGFDSDSLCTCPDLGACASKNEGRSGPCDPPGNGIDNAAGAIIRLLFQGADVDRPIQEDLARGVHGTIVDLDGWNGTADDPDVTVALYNVAGVRNGMAKFDGNDELIAADESLLDPSFLSPKYFDTTAYVSGGVLVATFDSYDLRLVVEGTADASTEVSIPMRAAHLIGRINRVGAEGLEILDAQLIGRLPEREIFQQVSRVGVCRDGGLYDAVKESLCAALDIPSSPSSDGKDVPCDAISFAIGLVVRPAKLAGHAPVAPLAQPCGVEPPDECR